MSLYEQVSVRADLCLCSGWLLPPVDCGGALSLTSDGPVLQDAPSQTVLSRCARGHMVAGLCLLPRTEQMSTHNNSAENPVIYRVNGCTN